MQAISSTNSSWRWPVIVTAAFALTVATAYAFLFVFSRSMSLDEGYLMVTVQGFNSGHALYDEVFTQYGPFYYFYEWVLHSGLRIPLTHDVTRLLCVLHWLGAAVILGGAAWRLTRSALASVFVALLAVAHLSAVANEPGHPQEIIVVLLALASVVVGGEKRGRWNWAVLGLITALLFCIKINVGVFFGVALFLALRCHTTDRFSRNFWNLVLLAFAIAAPLLLVLPHFGRTWCQVFYALAACTTLATLWVAQRVAAPRSVTHKDYFVTGLAFALGVGLLLGVTLLTGTSREGLMDGLLRTPMKMPRVALLPIVLPSGVLLGAAASLGMAVLAVRKRDDARTAQWIAGLKLAYASVGALLLIGDAKNQLGWLLPWAWLVSVPNRDDQRTGQFARVFLALAAAWQMLQAYPIAGTQVTLATSLLVLAYGVCLSDALAVLAKLLPRLSARLAATSPGMRTLAPVLAGVLLLFLFTNHWGDLSKVRGEYARLRPLGLPGSSLVRMDDETVEMYRDLAGYLAAESDTFVAYPGINSLYFWTGRRPPTQINSTGWGQLSTDQQEIILSALRHGHRPRLVVVEAMMKNWHQPYADPIRPLVRFVQEECRPVRRLGRFMIFELNPEAEVARTN